MTTPHERRMRDIEGLFLNPEGELYERMQRYFAWRMDHDIAWRVEAKKLFAELPHWHAIKRNDGSGLSMSNALREHFDEIFHRVVNHGILSLPAAFNVSEAFFAVEVPRAVFALRPEIDHLLDVADYLDWYEQNGLPRDPGVLSVAMKPDTIYSFSFSCGENPYAIECAGAEYVMLGAAFIRHQHELSCFLLAGQNPPSLSDDEGNRGPMAIEPGREAVVDASKDIPISDRYLRELPTHARVLIFTRFDLRASTYNVRYVLRDSGRTFDITTDDERVFGNNVTEERRAVLAVGRKRLDEMAPLFSAAAALMHLPLVFVDRHESVREIEVSTALAADRRRTQVREAIKALGQRAKVFKRRVRCLTRPTPLLDMAVSVTPPEMKFDSSGFWKILPGGAIGEDADGMPIVGRTWVKRLESWTAATTSEFLMRREPDRPRGPDPGVIYVSRSPAMAPDLYKIGLTRGTAEKRAAETSSATGVAMPFAVIEQWEVGDCGAIEKAIHARLVASSPLISLIARA